ncbi:MAG: hypothetical protein CL943_00070 [Candidatus Diapherotrites archaeon]|uniref:Uncharacterized protein n=1 Tax=Candidatus Iainarchaeum sp. TaxID=3101447 RepID=A0A2D6LZT0_9ARCH|nr:hypothetical protein [Candidatus Diapherotrites archaeon]|tara:strand:+ start:3116 stop:3328 length:213 start_codon:yes stop_codon:yes gene_type:complete
MVLQLGPPKKEKIVVFLKQLAENYSLYNTFSTSCAFYKKSSLLIVASGCACFSLKTQCIPITSAQLQAKE